MTDSEAFRVRREEIHVYFHMDPLTVVLTHPRSAGQPVTAILTIGGRLMPGTISIDEVNEVASVVFVDDHGDTDAAAPPGAVVAYTSDNPAVATVDPSSGKVSPVAEGAANIGATIQNADGTPVLEPDGVTAFAVAPGLVTVTAGAAVGAALKLSV